MDAFVFFYFLLRKKNKKKEKKEKMLSTIYAEMDADDQAKYADIACYFQRWTYHELSFLKQDDSAALLIGGDADLTDREYTRRCALLRVFLTQGCTPTLHMAAERREKGALSLRGKIRPEHEAAKRVTLNEFHRNMLSKLSTQPAAYDGISLLDISCNELSIRDLPAAVSIVGSMRSVLCNTPNLIVDLSGNCFYDKSGAVSTDYWRPLEDAVIRIASIPFVKKILLFRCGIRDDVMVPILRMAAAHDLLEKLCFIDAATKEAFKQKTASLANASCTHAEELAHFETTCFKNYGIVSPYVEPK